MIFVVGAETKLFRCFLAYFYLDVRVCKASAKLSLEGS